MKKITLAVFSTLLAFNAFPFGIEIDTSQVKDKSIWGVTGDIIQTKHLRKLLPKLGQPVHETITKTAIEDNEKLYSVEIDEVEVMNGVLHNDDPDGFLLPKDSDYNPKGYSLLHEGTRWLVVFGKVASRQFYINKTAELKQRIKEINEDYEFGDITRTTALSARLATASAALLTLNTEFKLNPNMLHASHFGNLQFLHSMGQSEDTRDDVRKDILDYMEYSWRLASGEVSLDQQKNTIESLKASEGTSVVADSIVVEMIREYPKTDLIFHAKDDNVLRNRALGSILHVVQDSYAKGHTVREDWESTTSYLANSGRIRYFQSYSEQDGSKHGEHDIHDHGIEKWQEIPGAMTAYTRSSEIVKYFVLGCTYRNLNKTDHKDCPAEGMESYFGNEVFGLMPYTDQENKVIDYLNMFNQFDTSLTKSHESLK